MPTELPKRKTPRALETQVRVPVVPLALVTIVIVVTVGMLMRVDLSSVSDGGTAQPNTTFDTSLIGAFGYSP
jgi:hypothetical protein